jgi:hypothetical protein
MGKESASVLELDWESAQAKESVKVIIEPQR